MTANDERRKRILGELLSLLYDAEHATGDAQSNFDDEAVGIDPPATGREIEDALLWLCEQFPRHDARKEQPHAGGGDGDGR